MQRAVDPMRLADDIPLAAGRSRQALSSPRQRGAASAKSFTPSGPIRLTITATGVTSRGLAGCCPGGPAGVERYVRGPPVPSMTPPSRVRQIRGLKTVLRALNNIAHCRYDW